MSDSRSLIKRGKYQQYAQAVDLLESIVNEALFRDEWLGDEVTISDELIIEARTLLETSDWS